ncbi:MAG: KAP family P-loop NTPase fold protein [Aeromonas salmonicida]
MTLAAFNWGEPLPWDGPGAIDGVVEELAGDRLDRARYAEFLTNYLAAEGKQRNYVLNLNAEWGAGKTWFIKRWYMELKAHYPTVYIDAWQQDFSDDPLLTVISSIIEQLKAEAGSPQLSPYLSTKLASLLKATAPIVTKALFKKVSGINIDEVQEVITADDAGKLVESLFQDTRKKTEAVQLLKHEIKQWVEAIIGKKKKQAPAFILIDELDRCRPSYAVEMLETIKHIFDIPGVVFVLATDTEQLQHAIKVVYGDEFNAFKYLERFFTDRYELPKSEIFNYIFEISNRFDDFPSMCHINYGITSEQFSEFLVLIIKRFELQLRDTQSLLNRLVATYRHASNDRKPDILLMAILIAKGKSVSIKSEHVLQCFIDAIEMIKEQLISLDKIKITINTVDIFGTELEFFKFSPNRGVRTIDNSVNAYSITINLYEMISARIEVLKNGDGFGQAAKEKLTECIKNDSLRNDKELGLALLKAKLEMESKVDIVDYYNLLVLATMFK